jgi:hypothetical protein
MRTPQNQVTEKESQPTEESVFDMLEIDTRGYDKHVRNAQITLYVLSAFQLLALLTIGDMEQTAKMMTLAIGIGLAVFFVACGLISRVKPFAALTTATIVYGLLLLFEFIMNPAGIISLRLLLQGAMIVFLIRGVQNAKELDRIKRNFGK